MIEEALSEVWAMDMREIFNLEKTEAILIEAEWRIRPPVIRMDKKAVKFRHTNKYLGIKIDAKLLFLENVKVRKKENGVLGKVWEKIKCGI